MDRTAFVSTRLGTVRRTLEGYEAFYPAGLPRRLEYSAETVNMLAEATAAVHRLAGASRLLPSPDLLMGPYIRLEAVLSSRIEGTQTTMGQLLLFQAAEEAEQAVGDMREVLNYIDALNFALERLETLPVSLRLLRETHAILMNGVRGEHATPGEFRRTQNWIGNPASTLQNAKFIPPPVDHMMDSLSDLEAFLHERDLPDLVTLALAHYQFETIHPFLDGNGRIGRLLIPLVLAERGILPRPMLYLSAYFERRRAQYYELLFSTSAAGDVEPWLLFFLEGIATQSRDAEDRTVRLVDLLQKNREALMADGVSVNVVRLAEQLLDRPFVTATQVQRDLGVSFPTAQKAIEHLVDRGILVEITGQQRNRIYHSPEVFDIVYGDAEATSEGRI